MSAPAPTMANVFDDDGRYLGVVFARGKVGFEAIRRYVPDAVLADFGARSADAQIEARAEILRLLVAS